MWTRQELKTKAKSIFKKNYWASVIAGAVFSVVYGAGGFQSRHSQQEVATASNLSPEEAIAYLIGILAVGVVALAIGLVVWIFVCNPAKVGYSKFLLSCDENGGASVKTMWNGVVDHYVDNAIKMAITNIIIWLYTLLLIIPGIYKAYQYRWVAYLLCENPELSGEEARRISKEMMEGQKWETFVLDLSFIGWYLLSGITMGVLGVFYVMPYVGQTDCELYKKLRGEQQQVIMIEP